MYFQVFTTISLLVTIVLITTFICETHQCCRVPRNATEVVELTPFKQYREKTKPHPALYYIEIACMIALTLETIARLVVCPVRKLFFKNPLNVFDLISLLSFYITAILFMVDTTFMERQIILPLQLLRLFRVLRIFKVATHLPALKILFHTLKASAMELLLMLILIISLILCFASVIYFAEQFEEVEGNDFTSIPIGFWWAIVTMTTLGYGDRHPQTALGYLIGSICAIFGVLFIALPIPIIVNNFSTYYTHAKAQEKLPKKKKVALVGAADALKQTMQELMVIPTVNTRLDNPTLEPSSGESSLISNDIVHNPTEDSKETVKHSDNSTVSTSSTDRTTGVISVTFTDVEESAEATEFGFKVNSGLNGTVLCNGYTSSRIGGRANYIAEDEEMNNELNSTNSQSNAARGKRSPQSNAVSRRASLLPGGVSNMASPGESIVNKI